MIYDESLPFVVEGLGAIERLKQACWAEQEIPSSVVEGLGAIERLKPSYTFFIVYKRFQL